jgi:precorrin-6B C5,15-methyltransferase / cobalt-precorrin-6B C5,C15-methyltransferase
MKPWLTIIGIGEDGYEGLGAAARLSLQQAKTIVGSKRTLAMLPNSGTPGPPSHEEWPQPFSAVVDQMKRLQGSTTAILATGDPMNYGVARKLFEFIPKSEVTIIPHLSAFTLAAARMGWSLPDCDCFTIHGRPAANVEPFIQPEARLLILTQDETSPAEVCRRLITRGFESSEITVLENLGGATEKTTTFKANALPDQNWSPLNTLAVHCIASPNAKIWSRLAGLPDQAFAHDGQLTKREVRAATLAALAPASDQLLWDVGAGAGSIAIEWMRSTRGCEAIAIEHDETRCAMIATNMDQLGTPRLKLVKGKAPAALSDLPAPHAIFIGGGIDDEGVFETCWQHLRPFGNLVANTVTLEGERQLITLQEKHGGELVRMDVSTLTHVGDLRALRPRMSVLQWRVRKS